MIKLPSGSKTPIDRRSMLGVFAAGCACCLTSGLPQPAHGAGDSYRCSIYRNSAVQITAEPNDLKPLREVDEALDRYFEFDFARLRKLFGGDGTLLGSASKFDIYAKFEAGPTHATEGKIVFGQPLFGPIMSEKFGLLKLTAILAHEYAHLFQGRSGDYAYLQDGCGKNDRPDLLVELHADYLAGVYMATRGGIPPEIQDELAGFLYGLGDASIANNHHGLPAQRLLAFRNGFNTTAGYVARDDKIDIYLLAAEGKKYVPIACQQKTSPQ